MSSYENSNTCVKWRERCYIFYTKKIIGWSKKIVAGLKLSWPFVREDSSWKLCWEYQTSQHNSRPVVAPSKIHNTKLKCFRGTPNRHFMIPRCKASRSLLRNRWRNSGAIVRWSRNSWRAMTGCDIFHDQATVISASWGHDLGDPSWGSNLAS